MSNANGGTLAPSMTQDSDKKSPGDDSKSWSESGRGFLGKKFGGTSRLVVSSKMWMNTIPTRDCDVLMTFPAKTDDSTLMWLLSRLRARVPDLVVHVRHHSNTGLYGFYLTASYNTLLQGAEELSIKKPIKTEYGGGKKEFVYEDQEYFDSVDDSTMFLTSEERQSIVRHMLYNLRAVVSESLGKVKFLEGQAIVPYLMSKNVIQQVLPLHNNDDVTQLRQNWVRAFLRKQPLDKICEYFGVKISMYFAYLGHYTRALVLPALLGIIMWCADGRSQYSDDAWFVVFAAVNVIWATLYLEGWKRTSAEKAYRWGTLDKEDELLKEPRPLFHGYTARSPVTGRPERRYPTWKRNAFRYFVSYPIIGLCLFIVFATMWAIFELQDWINGRVKLGDFPSFSKFVPKVLLAISIGIFDDIYKKIAYWLNDRENHRLEETYETNLIIKMVLFQFVNSFLSLFYIAFYLRDMDRLKDQLATLLITRQVIGNIKEAVIPFFLGKAKLVHMGYKMTEGLSKERLEKQAKELAQGHGVKSDGPGVKSDGAEVKSDSASEDGEKEGKKEEEKDGVRHRGIAQELKQTPEGELSVTHSGPQLTQAEVEASQKAYEDTFEDYLEMLIQFGYVTLFSSAFPLAALCALINNVIEIRSDAFKLCYTFQRPFGQRVENIGTWQDALEVMSVIAVMVNCALIGMSGLADRLFPELSAMQRFVFIVALEHLILTLKFMLAYAIPDIPHWVAQEKARLEFLRREALKRLESKASTDSKKAPLSPSLTEDSNTKASSPLGRVTTTLSEDKTRTTTIITTTTRRSNTPPGDLGGDQKVPHWEGRPYGIPDSISYRRSTTDAPSETGIKESQVISRAQFGLQRAEPQVSYSTHSRSINVIKRGDGASS